MQNVLPLLMISPIAFGALVEALDQFVQNTEEAVDDDRMPAQQRAKLAAQLAVAQQMLDDLNAQRARLAA